MLNDIDGEAAKHDMSRSEYIRHCVRDHQSNNLETPNVHLAVDENGKNRRQNEGAA